MQISPLAEKWPMSLSIALDKLYTDYFLARKLCQKIGGHMLAPILGCLPDERGGPVEDEGPGWTRLVLSRIQEELDDKQA